jgi:hypothetical protein
MYKNLSLLLSCWLCLVPLADARVNAYTLPAAIPGEFTEILNNKTEKPIVFAYKGKNNITIIDLPTLAEQGRMFNRIVVLFEMGDVKKDVKNKKVLNDDELSQFIKSIGKMPETLAYGNNLAIDQLVIFFNLAHDNKIQLNAEELALRQHLLDRGLIKLQDRFYQNAAPSGAIVLSIPQIALPNVTDTARSTILSHEMSHGEYATNSGYREFCKSFWHSVMSKEQRAAFRKFLSSNDYNPNDEELMINETQAYLMYTPDPRAFSPEKVGMNAQDIATLQNKFLRGFPSARQPSTSLN